MKVIILIAFIPVLTAGDLFSEEPLHLKTARAFIKSLSPENNSYGTRPTTFVWADEARRDKPVFNRSVCSSFCVALLRKSYRLDKATVTKMFSEQWPEVDDMVAGVKSSGRFTMIPSIRDLKPGDFILIDYLSNKKIPTGHIMLVNDTPEQIAKHHSRRISFRFSEQAVNRQISFPYVLEWHTEIIDSSKSPHGEKDTRYRAGDSNHSDGAGMGVIRILTDQAGIPVGYTWSTSRISKLWLTSDRPILLVRWKG